MDDLKDVKKETQPPTMPMMQKRVSGLSKCGGHLNHREFCEFAKCARNMFCEFAEFATFN